jgi:magnesium chelatase subunit D
MDEIKQALILSVINPRMGGVVIEGRRGTGKSVLARAVHRLLPSHIERIKGSPYNVDPEGSFGVDSVLQDELQQSGESLSDMETELVPTPFVQIPINAMESNLLGTVDLERSIQSGVTEFSPGLLARAHRGILYVDEINLLDEEAVNVLLSVIADGYVTIEREGLSLRYPCRPLLIATFNPAEGELREHLLDRIGVALSADVHPLNIRERVQGVENVLGFSGGTEEQFSAQARQTLDRVEQEESELREKVVNAMSLLPQVKIDRSQILYLCEEATRAGCEGQRAEIFAAEAAKTNAAVSIGSYQFYLSVMG